MPPPRRQYRERRHTGSQPGAPSALRWPAGGGPCCRRRAWGGPAVSLALAALACFAAATKAGRAHAQQPTGVQQQQRIFQQLPGVLQLEGYDIGGGDQGRRQQQDTDAITPEITDEITPEIVNGQPASWTRTFPYLVGVQTPKANCTGFFIQADTVVTAANCFDGAPVLTSAFAATIKVYWYGKTNGLQSPFLPGKTEDHRVLPVRSVVVHPLYNPNNFEYDVAVLLLGECAAGGAAAGDAGDGGAGGAGGSGAVGGGGKAFEYILRGPNRAPGEEGNQFQYRSVSDLIVPGWGRNTTGGPVSGSLQVATVRYNPDIESCNPNKELQFCAKAKPGRVNGTFQDACVGDNGSPLIYSVQVPSYGGTGSTKAVDRVVGILSGGKACGQVNTPDGREVSNLYTNVTVLWTWLEAVMNQTGACSPDFDGSVDPGEYSCYTTRINLDPESPMGDCQYTLIRKDRLFMSSGSTEAQYSITWTRKSFTSSAPPPLFDFGGLKFYQIFAGDAYGYVVSTPSGLACSGAVRVFPCTPQCKNVTKTIDANIDPTCVVSNFLLRFATPSDFWDVRSIAGGATKTVLFDGTKRVPVCDKDGKCSDFAFPDSQINITGPPGTYLLSGEVYYSDMKSNRSAQCTLTVVDVTLMAPPTPRRQRNGAPPCFYRSGRVEGGAVAIPLESIAVLPNDTARCGKLRSGRKIQRLVAVGCEAAAVAPPSGGGGGRRSPCRYSNPTITQSDLAPLGAIIVDLRSAKPVQNMTAQIQTWNLVGTVGGGLDGPTPTLSVNFTLYKSAVLGKKRNCSAVDSTWVKNSNVNNNIDECRDNNGGCSLDAQCKLEADGVVSCKCNDGYDGDGKTCTDVDECADDNGGCSKAWGICNNFPGGSNCFCKAGFSLAGDRKACIDIDECTVIRSVCGIHGTCNNFDGGYNCNCFAGWQFNETTCVDINECAPPTACGGGGNNCTNLPGNYTCSCLPGWANQKGTCEEIDECTEGTDDCDKRGGAVCTNTIGSYTCACKKGFLGDGRECTDIDECAQNPCHPDAKCVNTPGNYSCTCKQGYRGNGTECQDIDECKEGSHSCHPEANCTNTIGDFNCTCTPGFTGEGVACRGGPLMCWASLNATDIQQFIPSNLGPVVAVAVSSYSETPGFRSDFVCAVAAATGRLSCYGQPPPGDDGNLTADGVPEALGPVREVRALGSTVCAVTLKGATTCWGSFSSLTPDELTLDGSTASVSVGSVHACALKASRAATCWSRIPGFDSNSSLSGRAEVPPALQQDGAAAAVACGNQHTCVLSSSGNVSCFGGNNNKQTSVPANLTGAVAVSAGWQHSCAIAGAGRGVVCWGGVVSTNSSGPGMETQVPPDLGPVAVLAAGNGVSVSVSSGGKLRVWPDKFNSIYQPVPSNLGPVATVAVGEIFACAVRQG